MKKYFGIALIALLSACGPSAEEKAKMEQAHQDSVKAADDMMRAAEEAAAAAAMIDTMPADTASAIVQ